MKKRGLSPRILQMNLLMMLPILVLFSAAAFAATYGMMRQSQVRFLTSESYMSQVYLMEQLNRQPGENTSQENLRDYAPAFCGTLADTSGLRVQIFSREGELLGDSALAQAQDLTQDVYSAAGGIKAYTFFVGNRRAYISFSSPIYVGAGQTIGAIRYLTRQEDDLLMKRLWIVLGLLAILATGICCGASYFLAESIAAPILCLKNAINSMEQGRPSLAVDDSLEGEFQELEAAFLSMEQANSKNIRRLGQEKEKQNLFFNSATHQLKTPLTSIIGYSEIIQRMSQDPDVTISAEYIEAAGRDLLAVVENIIDISRFQRTEHEFNPTWFHLEELCGECAKLLRPRLERSGIVLNNQCAPAEIFYDRERIREVLLNILDNSILHSGCSHISITSATLPVRLLVEDDGCGIPQEQLKRLFEPFYRPAHASTGGSGLGLAICKESMRAQGGNIAVERVESSGTGTGTGTRIILYFQNKDQPQSWYGNMARRI